jgi:spastin
VGIQTKVLLHPTDAALEPIRGLDLDQVKDLDASKLRHITMSDFHNSLKRVKKSVSPSSLRDFEKWSQDYASV